MQPGLGDTQVPALPDVLPAPSSCRLLLTVKAPRSRGLMAQSSCPSDCYAFPEASVSASRWPEPWPAYLPLALSRTLVGSRFPSVDAQSTLGALKQNEVPYLPSAIPGGCHFQGGGSLGVKHRTPAETMASSEVTLGSICQSLQGSPKSSCVVSRLVRPGEPFVHRAPPPGDGNIIHCLSCVS